MDNVNEIQHPVVKRHSNTEIVTLLMESAMIALAKLSLSDNIDESTIDKPHEMDELPVRFHGGGTQIGTSLLRFLEAKLNSHQHCLNEYHSIRNLPALSQALLDPGNAVGLVGAGLLRRIKACVKRRIIHRHVFEMQSDLLFGRYSETLQKTVKLTLANIFVTADESLIHEVLSPSAVHAAVEVDERDVIVWELGSGDAFQTPLLNDTFGAGDGAFFDTNFNCGVFVTPVAMRPTVEAVVELREANVDLFRLLDLLRFAGRIKTRIDTLGAERCMECDWKAKVVIFTPATKALIVCWTAENNLLIRAAKPVPPAWWDELGCAIVPTYPSLQRLQHDVSNTAKMLSEVDCRKVLQSLEEISRNTPPVSRDLLGRMKIIAQTRAWSQLSLRRDHPGSDDSYRAHLSRIHKPTGDFANMQSPLPLIIDALASKQGQLVFCIYKSALLMNESRMPIYDARKIHKECKDNTLWCTLPKHATVETETDLAHIKVDGNHCFSERVRWANKFTTERAPPNVLRAVCVNWLCADTSCIGITNLLVLLDDVYSTSGIKWSPLPLVMLLSHAKGVKSSQADIRIPYSLLSRSTASYKRAKTEKSESAKKRSVPLTRERPPPMEMSVAEGCEIQQIVEKCVRALLKSKDGPYRSGSGELVIPWAVLQ